MKLSEELEMIHDSGNCGIVIDGLSKKAANIEGHIEKLEIKLVESLNQQTEIINDHNNQIQNWISLAAALYQACGAYDMPERVLDVLNAAQCGEPFDHLIDGILPCYPESETAQVPDGFSIHDNLIFVGYTNGCQILYASEYNGEGTFFKNSDHNCIIPVYMLKAHEHRIQGTSDGEVTLEVIERAKRSSHAPEVK